MTDEGIIKWLVGQVWELTDLTQTQFAEVLRHEADLYEEAPELGADPNRAVDDEGRGDYVIVPQDDLERVIEFVVDDPALDHEPEPREVSESIDEIQAALLDWAGNGRIDNEQ